MTSHFTFFASYYDSVEKLDSSTKGEFFDVLFKYALRDELPSNDVSAVVFALFTMAKPNLDKSKAKRESGQAGGKQTVSKPQANHKQTVSKSEKDVSDKEKEKEKEKENKKVPQKKPDGFVYDREFNSLWELLREGDKWNAYRAWRTKNEKYTYEQFKFVLIEESKKQFGKRHFSTTLNGDIDEVLSSFEQEEHQQVVRYV